MAHEEQSNKIESLQGQSEQNDVVTDMILAHVIARGFTSSDDRRIATHEHVYIRNVIFNATEDTQSETDD